MAPLIPPPTDDIKLLLLDDDRDLEVLLRDLLSEAEGAVGWEVEWKPTVVEGVEALMKQSFHACLIDNHIGQDSGIDLIRELVGQGVAIPLLLITHDDRHDVDMAAMEAGAATLFPKARLDPLEIERTIRYAIEHARDKVRLLLAARSDPLTGLHNRTSVAEKLTRLQSRLQRTGETYSVCRVDIDSFKAINETLGHSVGDDLMRQIADRIRRSVRPYDTVARLGSDDFVIVLEDVATIEKAVTTATRILRALSAPFEPLGHHQPRMTGSIGVIVAEQDTSPPEEVLEMLDSAVYFAKQAEKIVQPSTMAREVSRLYPTPMPYGSDRYRLLRSPPPQYRR